MFLIYCVILALFLTWVLLIVSGWLSFRWSRRDPGTRVAQRLIMAAVPLVLGYFLASFHLRITQDGEEMNASWPFILPMLGGAIALGFWLRGQWKRRCA